jgi:phage baseplate assembly protein W
MANSEPADQYRSFLGAGWSFPPTFSSGGVVMTADEDDILASLHILFHTTPGERFLQPKYGLDINALLFEPMSTTLRTFLTDQVRTAILIHEPRIKLINLTIDSPDPNDGSLRILVEYEVRATNSRFNLVFPFYKSDSNEVRAAVAGATS